MSTQNEKRSRPIQPALSGAENGGSASQEVIVEWTLDRAGLLARYNCNSCGGTGLAPSNASALALPAPSSNASTLALPPPAGPALPCICVCRRVFQSCYRRFRICAAADES